MPRRIDGKVFPLTIYMLEHHFKIAKICLNLKIHLLVAKPLTPSKKESVFLTNLALKKNVLGMVEFHKRYLTQLFQPIHLGNF